MTAPDVLSLSIVVPVYSGAEHLEALVQRQEALQRELAARRLPVRHLETIFVCDEPIDASARVLETLAATRPWMTVLHLGKNAGQHAATAAGLLHTSGDWIVTMDEDGQHDPLAVLALLDATLPKSADLCYARPTDAVHAAGWRNLSSRWAKRFVSWLVSDPRVPLFNSFRLVRGEVGRAAGALATHDMYLDVALGWFTSRVIAVPLELKDPRAERSGYSLLSLLGHLRRLVLSYHLTVLRYATLAGVATAVVLGGGGLVSLVVKLLDPAYAPVRGWTSMFVIVSFFGGLTVFLLGIILERLSITLSRAQGQPAFFIVDRTRDALYAGAAQPALPEQQPA